VLLAAISAALLPWRRPWAVHGPGKILLDVAITVALGGDCLADVGMLRAEPALFGQVASDPTVSRLVSELASGGHQVLAALRTACAEVRERVWRLAGDTAPDAGGQVIVDVDGVLVLAHSEKQDATATWKKTFGQHPLMGFVDTVAAGPVSRWWACCARQRGLQHGRVIRADSGGGTHEFVFWLAKRGRWLSYSVGMTNTDAIHQVVLKAALAMDRCDHRCPGPAPRPPEPRLISSVPIPTSSTTRPEPWNPAPARRDSRALNLPRLRKTPPVLITRGRQQADGPS
jgi:hypothetical protein